MKKVELFSISTMLIITMLLTYHQCNAAVILEQVSYMQSNPSKTSNGTIYISNNRIKLTENITNSTIIFDFEKDKIIKIDNEYKTYAVTSSGKYVDAFHNEWLKQKYELKKDILNLPEDKRAFQIKILKSRGIDIYGEDKPQNINIKVSEVNETIANHKTINFKIFRASSIVEEYWLSNTIKEIDYTKFARFYGRLQSIANMIYLDSSNRENITNTLETLFKNGYPLKFIDYQTSGNRVEEITAIKYINLKDSDFMPPPDYNKAHFW